MEKKNTVLLTVIAVATLLVAVIGATFAYFSATVSVTDGTDTETVIKAAELGITFTGTQEITLADNVVPGWNGAKKFTVENTSDYDMSFDIYFTETTNGFNRQQDLVYEMTASYIESSNSSVTAGTTLVQMINGEGAKETFGVSSTQMPATSENPVKVVRVFIPAHTKEEFVMNVTYVNAVDDEGTPVNQNEDQGAEFSTTISIVANGIENNATRVTATPESNE